MPVDLTPEEWAQVRYEYEHTDKPVDDICLDHGISPNTLRDRVRRWRWTRRRQPIPAEGPPPALRNEPALPFVGAPPFGMAPPEPAAVPREGTAALPAPHATPGEAAPADPAEIVPRLQGAVARVLPAIEAIVARLAAEPMPPREMERAARTLTSLTRTLRELNELLSQHQPARPHLRLRHAGRYRRVQDRAGATDRGVRGFESRRRKHAAGLTAHPTKKGGEAALARLPVTLMREALTSRWNCSPGSGSRCRPSRPGPSWRRSPRG